MAQQKKKKFFRFAERQALLSGSLQGAALRVSNLKIKTALGAAAIVAGFSSFAGVVKRTARAKKGKGLGTFVKGVVTTQLASGAGMIGVHVGANAFKASRKLVNKKFIFRRVRGRIVPIRIRKR